MNVFVSTDHAGFWPVGVCSVVIAPDEVTARRLLTLALIERGLNASKSFTLRRLNMDVAKALILNDGEY